MPIVLNALYLFALAVLSPWLVYKALRTGKYRIGVARKFLGTAFVRTGSRSCAWFHGVSVGEIHLLRQVVVQFQQRFPDWDCVISTTTNTGFDEARKRFPDVPVIYWPFDFSWAVNRALARVRPDVVILAEGELWPNFLLAAERHGVPVVMINGRLSPRSAARHHRLRALLAPFWRKLQLVAAQNEEYARYFCSVGVAEDRLRVTGSVKYDGVEASRDNLRTEQMRRLFGIRSGDLVWIAGSTQDPEEQLCLDIAARALHQFPRLKVFLVPRQKDRFEEVARLMVNFKIPFIRRSQMSGSVDKQARLFLVDSIGELGALWGLADVAFVGGSLDGHRGGQNMIEPAAFGAAVVFGPHVWNFKETASRLLAAGAALQVGDGSALQSTILELLGDAPQRREMGEAARRLVSEQQGATRRTIDLLERLLSAGRPAQAA